MVTNQALAVDELPEDAAPENSSPDTLRVRGFVKGFDPRRNTAGRIAKRPTVWDETQKLASQAKHRRRIAAAAVATMEVPHSPSGVRERALYHDRDIGTVVLRHQVDIGESRADAADAYIMQLLTGQTVDGEAKDITDQP